MMSPIVLFLETAKISLMKPFVSHPFVTSRIIGASLSEPHTSRTALWKCVNVHTYVLACGHIPYILNERIQIFHEDHYMNEAR